MTKTWSKVCLGASLSFLLLSGCASAASDTNSGASSGDAGRSPDASAQPNELPDAGAAANGGSGDTGGKGGTSGKSGNPSSGGSGGAGGQDEAGSPGSDEPAGGSGGDGSGGAEQAPPVAGAPAGAGGTRGDDADAGTTTPPRDPNAICTTCGACEETVPIVSTMHTNMPVTYPDPPPTSGPHNPCWAAWGIHDEPLAAERWVHNMEHGGIVFTYNCPDGCADDVAALKNLVGARSRTVLAAYDKLPARFAVTSWGHRLVSDCLDEQAFAAFYTAHFDRGPESNSNPPNPSCPP